VSRSLGPFACRTGVAIVLDKVTEAGPGVFTTDEFESLVEPIVAGKDVVVLVAEHTETEVSDSRNVDLSIKTEKTSVVGSPSSRA
jgi:hypothetical protein